jgi:hypothetical protein
MKKEEGGMKPTKTFKNVLPPTFNSWHLLFDKLLEDAGNDHFAINENPTVEIMRPGRELHLYKFDLDFIKARNFDEGRPIIQHLIDELRGGRNYSKWEQLLRSFYNDYSKLIS